MSEQPTAPERNGVNPASSDQTASGKNSRLQKWVEGVSVLLLALASITAAWCGYQATLWGGEQSTHYTEAGARRVESVRASGLATQLTQVDIAVLIQWVDAYQTGNEELADFYESRFSDVLRPAFEAWIALDPFNNPDAPNAPFGMPEYQQPELIRSNELEAEAASLFEQGQADNKMGDNFVLATVFLATALFFLAISTSLEWMSAKLALTGIGGAMIIMAWIYMTTLEIAG